MWNRLNDCGHRLDELAHSLFFGDRAHEDDPSRLLRLLRSRLKQRYVYWIGQDLDGTIAHPQQFARRVRHETAHGANMVGVCERPKLQAAAPRPRLLAQCY